MFLIDDIFLAPFRGLTFVADAVYDAAKDHVENERTALRDELNDLYMQLEVGEISEEEFDEREEEILDRLDDLRDADQKLSDTDT
jgi:DNA phosphorothioation-dependent restriction protein DptG